MPTGCVWQLRGAVCAGAGPRRGLQCSGAQPGRQVQRAVHAEVQLQRRGALLETGRTGEQQWQQQQSLTSDWVV